MKAISEIVTVIHLSLKYDEAIWLMEYMQNQLYDSEDQLTKENREALFTILYHETREKEE